MPKNSVIILGIESSCDETSAAVIENGKILANIIANQDVHIKYGGVVPELASREHQKNIVPAVSAALKNSGYELKDLSAIAFTRGPGLIGSLLVGSSFAKGLSLGLNIPLIEVNHMQGHVLAHFIKERDGTHNAPPFPFLCLTVSGGHTQIVLIKDYFDMEIIGQTIDDAAGECFDKTAKILGLPYPGGPLIDKYAESGNPLKFNFTKPKVDGLDYSFSGLKTNILYFIRDNLKKNPNFISENLNDICASVQNTILEILFNKLIIAIKQTGINHIAVAGGVSANKGLRKKLKEFSEKEGWQIYIPKFEYCTDNAAMIAIAGYYKYLNNDFCAQSVKPLARLSF
jgi:N6-L-threonylcarbamoyladenine synthase